MKVSVHLTQRDIEQACAKYVADKIGEHGAVMFHVSKGDRPGDPDSISATVMQSDAGQR